MIKDFNTALTDYGKRHHKTFDPLYVYIAETKDHDLYLYSRDDERIWRSDAIVYVSPHGKLSLKYYRRFPMRREKSKLLKWK